MDLLLPFFFSHACKRSKIEAELFPIVALTTLENISAELGTRQLCRDNVTKFHKMVNYCNTSICVVASGYSI